MVTQNPINHSLVFQIKYDIVTCAFSLLDIPTERERINIVTDLWEKTEHFLVLVEIGTNAGFQVIAEARHVLTMLSKIKVSPRDEDESFSGQLFSPVRQLESLCVFNSTVSCFTVST